MQSSKPSINPTVRLSFQTRCNSSFACSKQVTSASKSALDNLAFREFGPPGRLCPEGLIFQSQ